MYYILLCNILDYYNIYIYIYMERTLPFLDEGRLCKATKRNEKGQKPGVRVCSGRKKKKRRKEKARFF